jgi:hypothetical protein
MGWTLRLKTFLGLDGAIAYTVLARICGIIGSAGTVLLIVHFMGRVEQGYYYVLLSLISLRFVFELGATLVVIQMAAHECVHLVFRSDGRIEGSPVARERLASLLKKTARWFSAVGILMTAILLPAGFYFFSGRDAHGMIIDWQWPWVLAVLATASLLVIDSIVFFLEGCGKVRQVARMRVWQAAIGALSAWTCLAGHHGLFAPGAVNLSYSVVGWMFLLRRRRLLGALFRHPAGDRPISWRAEVWPFQWRLGVSSLCVYFTTQAFTPIVFAARGPVEAGQIGMSMSIVGYLGTLVLAWMSTKAPTFGGLIARRDFQKLNRLFFSTLRRTVPLLTGMAIVSEAAIVALNHYFQHVAVRMVSPGIFALLLLTIIASHIVQSEGLYLRAFKREPFLIQSVIVSVVTVTMCLLLTKAFGNAGIALSYFVGTGIVGLISGTAIFLAWRRREIVPDKPDLMDKAS